MRLGPEHDSPGRRKPIHGGSGRDIHVADGPANRFWPEPPRHSWLRTGLRAVTTWLRVGAAADIAPGDYASVEIDGSFVVVYNIGGEFFAIDDVCTHDGGGLAGGQVEDHQVICPRHGSRFCLRTGKALTPPAYEPVRCYPTRVVDGIVEVASA